jgi:hypothetical protein
MSIPSITIRLDFPDGSATGTAGTANISSLPESAAPPPSPVDLPGLGSTAPASAADGPVPTPTMIPGDPATAAAAPAPSAQVVATDLAASSDAPPKPSADIPGLNLGAVGDDAEEPPQPEGKPAAKKATGGASSSK